MAYTTPITDRDYADILAQNSKAFFNVADWTRIYNNADHVNDQVNSYYGSSVAFTAVSSPTDDDISTIADFNTLLGNIEVLRAWVVANVSYSPSELDTEIKDDWVAGQGEVSPNWQNVNRWENHIDIMCWISIVQRSPITGVATAGAGLTRNNGFR